MNSRGIAIASILLVIVLMLGFAGRALKNRDQIADVPAPASSEQEPTNPVRLTALQEEVNRLHAEHERLSRELKSANQENTRLEKLKDQAEHAARLFKELANQSGNEGKDPTNVYPTIRHVLAGTGKQVGLAAELQAKWADVDEDKLPPAEQRAEQQAMLGIASEMLRLQRAAEQFKTNANEDFPQPATPSEMADFSSCYLYGALGLNRSQFSSVYIALEKYYSEAAQQGLLPPQAAESDEAKASRLAALGEFEASAQAEVESLLTPEQLALLHRPPLNQLKFVASKFYPPGFGIAFMK